MKVKKFNESFNIDNHEIEMMFYEYIDSKSIKIEDKYLVENELINPTPALKNPTKVRQCKLVTIKVGEGTGIQSQNNGIFHTSLDLIEDVISQLKRFYSIHNEDINFLITNDYMGMVVKFVVKGDFLKEEDSKIDLIEKYLTELKHIMCMYKKYRLKLGSNWLEMVGKDADVNYLNLHRVKTNYYEGRPTNDKINKTIDWYNRLTADKLKYELSGGDNQLIVKIKGI